MAIKSNNTANGIVIQNIDTTLLSPTTGRSAVTFASIHEQTGAQETIEFFLSSDATSASGERIGKIILAADEDDQPIFLLVTVPDGFYLIAKGTTGSLVECNITYTQYTGGS